MPFNPLGFRRLQFVFRSSSGFSNVQGSIYFHLSSSNEWHFKDFIVGEVEPGRIIFGVLEKQEVIHMGYNWNDIDKIKIYFFFSYSFQEERDGSYYSIFQIDYITADRG